MITVLIFISLVVGLNNLSDNLELKWQSYIGTFHAGQTIYQYEDYMNHKGKVIQVKSNGAGFCRGQYVRKVRLPFTPYFREEKYEGALDSCTGQIYHNGIWSQ